MGFFDFFKRAPKTEVPDLAVSRFKAAPMRRGTAELLEAYKLMPDLRAIVDAVAEETASKAAWQVYRPTRSGAVKFLGKEPRGVRTKAMREMLKHGALVPVPKHPALQLLANPSDHLSSYSTVKLIQTHLDLVGEAFLVFNLYGKMPVGFWPLPPSAVTNLPDYSLPRDQQFYRFSLGTISGVIPADQVLYLKHPDPADPMGRGTGKASTLADELDTDEYAARFAKNFFYNNAVPAAVMAIEGMPSGDTPAAKRFKEQVTKEHGGVDNAGKLLITGGKVTVARLDTDFQKMDLKALREYIFDFVRMTYRVPPEIVGDLTNSNKATAWAAATTMARQVVTPRLEFLRAEFQKGIVDRLGGEGDFLDYESPDPQDTELMLRTMGTFPTAFTKNEARMLVGMQTDPSLEGQYLDALPGQVEHGPRTPDAAPGSEADMIEEQGQPSSQRATTTTTAKQVKKLTASVRTWETTTKADGSKVYRFRASDGDYDRVNDRIFVSGWDVRAFNAVKGPILWQHDRDSLPVGKGRAYVEGDALVCEIEFDPGDDFARDLQAKVEAELLNTVSVGFAAIETQPNDRGGLDFIKTELLEVSLVTVPANPRATRLKRLTDSEWSGAALNAGPTIGATP